MVATIEVKTGKRGVIEFFFLLNQCILKEVGGGQGGER